MVCERFQSDGMRFLDNELSDDERRQFEEHVKSCDDCRRELHDFGRVVDLTNDFKLKAPDEEFWVRYWDDISHRLERGAGFFLMIAGMVVVLLYAVYRAVTSPDFLTFKGISIAVILLGLVVVFLSVVRERFHESKNDPYKGVRQ